jgi:putative colanic acid biosynthesis acetyltransferase WcaF
MAKNSCLADDVDCYNPSLVNLGELAIVSQYAFLCTASHDYNDPDFAFLSRPIAIERLAWVAARAYVGPGVTIREGAIVGANSCVYSDVPSWVVVGGNPAKTIGRRRIESF